MTTKTTTKHEVEYQESTVTDEYRWKCTCGGYGSWRSIRKVAMDDGKVHADYHNNKRRK